MTIKTERLELIPLTVNQLKLWIEDISALEKELGCSYQAESMEGFFLEIVKGQYEITRKDPDNYVWHSFFLLIRKDDRVVVGPADEIAAVSCLYSVVPIRGNRVCPIILCPLQSELSNHKLRQGESN
jgi:hypothetical protein